MATAGRTACHDVSTCLSPPRRTVTSNLIFSSGPSSFRPESLAEEFFVQTVKFRISVSEDMKLDHKMPNRAAGAATLTSSSPKLAPIRHKIPGIVPPWLPIQLKHEVPAAEHAFPLDFLGFTLHIVGFRLQPCRRRHM